MSEGVCVRVCCMYVVAQLVEPSLEHRVLCLALCVSDSAQPAELP